LKIGVGVIGVGFIGEVHARAFSELDSSRLVAVADIDEGRARDVASKFGAEAYGDYHELLRRKDIEAVVVSTPDPLHLEPTLAAAEAGKHLLIEKPLATNPKEAQEIINAARRFRVRLMVGHSLRFHQSYADLHQIIDEGGLGQIVHIWARRNIRVDRARRLKGRVSAIFYLAVHDIDFMRWCLGSEVERVYAEARRGILEDLGVEDSIWTLLKFRNGTIGALENCWVLPENFGAMMDGKMEVVGTSGIAQIDTLSTGLTVWNKKGLTYAQSGFAKKMSRFFHVKSIGPIKEEARHFMECLKDKKEFLVSGEDGKAAVEIAAAIHESIRKGKPIYF